MRITSWLNSIHTRLSGAQQRRRRCVSRRYVEWLENRQLLTSIVYDGATQNLAVSVSDAEDIAVQVANDQFEVLIDGIQSGPTPATSIVQSLTIQGGSGDNLIDLSAIDLAALGGGTTTVVAIGGDGNDTLIGSAGADEISGGAGDDSVDGLAGADILFGESGADILLGGDGDDCLWGGDGDDSLWAGLGEDELFGGNGLDQVDGNDEPVADAGTDISLTEGDAITLDGTGSYDSDSQPSPLTYEWRSGSPQETIAKGVTAEIPWADLAADGWSAGGCYFVYLFVSDGDATDVDLVMVNVVGDEPEGSGSGTGSGSGAGSGSGTGSQPTVSISIDDSDISERTSSSNPNPGTFRVSRTGTDGDLIVKYAVAGSATSGSDYAPIGGSVQINDGEDFALITVTPVPDRKVEGNETITVTLTADSEYDLTETGGTQKTLTLQDNDQWVWDTHTGGTNGTGSSILQGDAVTDFDSAFDSAGWRYDDILNWVTNMGLDIDPIETEAQRTNGETYAYLFTRRQLTRNGASTIQSKLDGLWVDPGIVLTTVKDASSYADFSFSFDPVSGNISVASITGDGKNIDGDLEIGSGYTIAINNSGSLTHTARVTMNWIATVGRSIEVTAQASFGDPDAFGLQVAASETSNAGIALTMLTSSLTLSLKNVEVPDP